MSNSVVHEPVIRQADIPIIALADLHSPDPAVRRAVGERIDEANRRVGFLVITDHGVPADLIAEMHTVCEDFFAKSDGVKLPVRQPDPSISRGYMAPHARSLAASGTGMGEKDFVEYFAMGPTHRTGTGIFDHHNLWPTHDDRFREVWTAYFEAMESLTTTLLRGFALGLDLDENFFDTYCSDHCSVLFANGFPPVDAQPAPGTTRLGAHTDYGSVTILYRNENPSGLQVLQDDEWRHVPDIPGSFVVNIGDLMARWTNDRWVSTVHRVANPPRIALGRRRLSIPFFHQPDADALIEAIPTCVGADGARYDPITSGDNYLLKTARSTAA
ncbi:isopenicillin N synthase family dioxygenase [Rhodococcus sp. NPDC003322]